MQVLTTSTSSQSLKITVRSAVTNSDVIQLTNETTKEISYITITSYSVDSYYTTINTIFNLEENTFYTFKIQQGGTLNTLQDESYNEILTESNDVLELDGASTTSTIKHYNRIFCTNQTNYSINDNVYINKSSNNDYITL